MGKKFISRPVLTVAVVLLGATGWVFFGISRSTALITEKIHKEANLASHSFVKATRNFHDKYEKNTLEKDQMRSSYKTTLDKLSLEIERLNYTAARVKSLNAELTTENKILLADNTNLMKTNKDMAEGVQALQIKVRELKKKNEGFQWPWISNPSTMDKTTITKLRDNVKSLESRNRVLDNQVKKLYAALKPSAEQPPKKQAGEAPTLPYIRNHKNPSENARIISVNHDQEFVIINLGRAGGVENGQEWILREDKNQIASLKVIDARDSLAACDFRYLTQNRPIRVNDPVFLISKT